MRDGRRTAGLAFACVILFVVGVMCWYVAPKLSQGDANTHSLTTSRTSLPGTRTLLAFITNPGVIRQILEHLGLPVEPPCRAGARSPPAAMIAAW